MDKAIGRTRGELSIMLHTIGDGLGNPAAFLLSAGNDHDFIHAIDLLKTFDITGSNILADYAYGAQTAPVHACVFFH